MARALRAVSIRRMFSWTHSPTSCASLVLLSIATPDWENGSSFDCMPPRDVILTVGSEMLEATMSIGHAGSSICATAPYSVGIMTKTRLTNASLKSGYLSKNITIQERLEMVTNKNFITTELEPLFDAADVLRFGRDLFVQHGFTTNLKGIDWLSQHYRDHRVHALNFPGDPYLIHIDATFIPLRPGLILNNPERALPCTQRHIFKKNGWEIVEAARPAHNQPPPLCYSSVWLSMNVLALDPKTVCVEASEVHMMDQIDKLGMEVIPVPFREVYPCGGALH
jgi:glycine amidinotransferase